MKVKRIQLAEIICTLSAKMPANKLAKEVAAYMLSEGRVSELDALLRDVMALRANSGIIESNVESAHKLDAELAKQIKDVIKKLKPGAKHIIINESLNPDLIGGVKVGLPGEQLDASLRGKLNKMKTLVNQGIN